ncbi:glycosyltransferase family 2 protein [Salinimicrobium terrae]|uniref:glycosyltransferase family 2 protein n=1 Tax=Salinimicrobium terrae TaxID=470866 RepID=UPI000411E66C|nr:glycosyltransferase family 2 protein [Salinimicrobium terrae]
MGKVYAVILNYNSSKETVSLYNNLKELEYKDLDILIIDNDSKDKDQAVIRNYISQDSLLFNYENLGYAAGNNIGIKKAVDAEAEFVWVLNPDIRVESDTLCILLNLLESDPELAAVGPRIISREDKSRIFSDGEVMELSDGLYTFHKNHKKPVSSIPEKVDFEIDYIDGSSILLRTAALKELGLFPEEYFLYWEETDWCTNAKNHNWKLAVDRRARVYNLNSEKGKKYHYYSSRNKLLFSKKYGLNYKEVLENERVVLTSEILNRFRGKYFKPFFISRLKGMLAGIIKNANR